MIKILTINCFHKMVDRQKTIRFISNRNHCRDFHHSKCRKQDLNLSRLCWIKLGSSDNHYKMVSNVIDNLLTFPKLVMWNKISFKNMLLINPSTFLKFWKKGWNIFHRHSMNFSLLNLWLTLQNHNILSIKIVWQYSCNICYWTISLCILLQIIVM